MRFLGLFLLSLCAFAQKPPQGVWDAALTFDGRTVPFRMEFQGEGKSLKGALLDGDRRIWSTSGSFVDGELSLRWDYFDSELEARLENHQLTGAYSRRTRAGVVTRSFSARAFHAPKPVEDGAAPARFAGVWRIQADAQRGASVMDGLFRQSGDEVTGTIQRVDGDFGTLAGRANGDRLTLSHFDGIRATLIEATLTDKGTLEGVMDGRTRFSAARIEKAREMGIPEPPDPARYASVKNLSEPFAFRFQDVEGLWVSLSDERFRGKAVIVAITGSWCPNCHDEAGLLVELYKKYQARGLEIVSLGFEYTGEVERDRGQLRAFGQRHGIAWPLLLAGSTEDGEVLRKLPQLANFWGFPETLFLGRDHTVRAVHAGFAGPANPQEHLRLKHETEALVEKNLLER